jgi:MtrB/PioB family decaheme-associated outer membrane protein
MRKVMLSLAALMLVASAVQAQTPTASATDNTTGTQVTTAPQPASPFNPTGQVDFGIRGSDITGDGARFQRYRDLDDGGVLDDFRFNAENGTWLFEAGADNVGRDDQRFWGEFLQIGKVRASFSYDELPLLYSTQAETPYTTSTRGVFKMDTATRERLAANQTTIKAAIPPLLAATPLDSTRDTLSFAVSATPTKEWDVDVAFNSFSRSGTMLWFAPFGFSNVVELPAPIDNRTTDLNLKAEWANQNGMLRVGYDGSWFVNDILSLEWDNPLAVTDRVYSSAYSDGRAPSFARMAMAPDSTQHMVSAAGSYKLPARSRATAYFGVGSVTSDAAVLPYTTNTAAPVFPLDRANVDGEVRVFTTNLTFTSRPVQYLWLNARFRYRDHDNQTAPFHSPNWVNFDGAIRTDPLETEAFSITRSYFDVDASFTPFQFGAVKVGYGRYGMDNTPNQDSYPGVETFRVFQTTTDNVFRTSFDLTGHQYVTLRALYEHAVREGDGLDVELLDHVGEQEGMRHYDVANRTRDRITALVTVTPNPKVGFNASIAAGQDDYDDSEFGLRDNKNSMYSVGMDFFPNDTVSVGVAYVFEDYEAFQYSRSASPPPSPQFDDPKRDWTTDSDDTTKTFSANVDLTRVFPRTDLRFGYDHSSGEATYVYGLAAGSPLAAPQQLPPLENQVIRGTADLKYFLTERFALGFVYWYDEYKVEDFAMGPEVITGQADLPSTIVLGYLYAPYKAHTGMLRATVLW